MQYVAHSPIDYLAERGIVIMKTVHRKDQTRRPRVISKSANKSALDAALKLYSKFIRDKAGTKLNPNARTVISQAKKISGSGGSGSSGSSGNSGDSGDSGGTGSNGNQNSQSNLYKVSICPVKRPVSAIERGIASTVPKATKQSNTGKTAADAADTSDTAASFISRRIVSGSTVSGSTVSADGNGTKSQVTNNTVRKKAERAQSSRSGHSGHSIAAQLLADINIIFRAKNVSKLRTTSLLSALCADADKPWATFCNGRCINARKLSSILGEYRTGIHSKDIRFKAGVFKGYYRSSVVL
jgi:hypothetical protein